MEVARKITSHGDLIFAIQNARAEELGFEFDRRFI